MQAGNRAVRAFWMLSGLALLALAFFLLEGNRASAMVGRDGAAPLLTATPPPSVSSTVTVTPTGTPLCQLAWVERAQYPLALFSHQVASYDGDVYGFGGRDVNYVRLTDTYVYRTAIDQWVQLASMPEIRFWGSTVTKDNKIYVINGSYDQGTALSSLVYDPALNSWTTGLSGLMATYGQSTVDLNGKIYRIGGIGSGGYTNSMEEYGAALLAPMPQAIAWAQAAVIGNYIYVAGGSSDGGTLNKTYRYDPATDTWDDAAIADLPQPRAWAASGVVDGRWIIVGGVGTEGSAIAWDQQSNSWSPVSPPLYPRSDMGGTVAGNKLYIVGGLADTDNQVTSTTQEYDPSRCATSTPTLMPTATATTTATPTQSPTACAITFTDVPPASTFYPYISCLVCQGVISGYTSGCETGNPCFKPGSSVTRGQIAKIVSNAAGFADPAGAQLFEDVLPGSPFYDYVNRLAMRGIMQGYPCGGAGEPCGNGSLPYFRPNTNATRGQIAKIVSNAAGIVDPAGSQRFEDVAPGSPFYDYVNRLAVRGIMQGYPCGGAGEPCGEGNRPYFRPNSNATRGQTTKIVSNTFFPGCGQHRSYP
ncbi:MAG: S-layer homology domain-containing protein [Chloroflexota bacterium]